jgi:hypothetical protein
MYELDYLNPDVMHAELAYRREQLSGGHRVIPTRLGRWLRSRRPTRAQTR